ncbi:MAG: hypothetical protein E7290_13100 [Lachnospiraceae bacterium]|nr:hypothetical protein [Lachnospiraceae bacterium]
MGNRTMKILSISLAMCLMSGCSATNLQTDTTIESTVAEAEVITEQSTIQESEAVETTAREESTAIEDNTDVNAYIEIPLQEHSLELTGDTTPEKLQLCLLGNEGDDIKQTEYLVENKVRQILVRLTDGANADTVLYERKFSHTHFENGQLLMLQKDGKDYLMECDIYEQQGDAGYRYQVFNYENNSQNVIDGMQINFATLQEAVDRATERGETANVRKDVVPAFRESIEKWYEDATLLVCCDVMNYYYGDREVFISYGENTYQPREYFDGVWGRADEELQVPKVSPITLLTHVSHDHSFYENFGVEEFYTLQNTYEAHLNHDVDNSSTDIRDIIEVYTGNAGDGESGMILVKSGDANDPYSIELHTARAGWGSVYLIQEEEKDYLLELHLDMRGGFGELWYYVYYFGEQAGPNLATALEDGYSFEYQLSTLDEEAYFEWAKPMANYLKKAELLLSTHDGEVRVGPANDYDRFQIQKLLDMIRTYE